MTSTSEAPAPASPKITDRPIELSIVMPCLNEANALPFCLQKAQDFIQRTGITAEIILADNGSTDGSIEIAEHAGARVVPVEVPGYGAALKGGIEAARGQFVIMGDSDDSYDFSKLDGFVEKLREGADVVVGNRFAGGIEPGAMPPLHQYFGNPLITFIGRRFFGGDCRDFYCGLRGFRKDSVDKLNLQSNGMEFALEMLVKATMYGMAVREVETTLSPDRRGRRPHLRSWQDGWRSLKFFLLFSPKWLFWYPGLVLLTLGVAAMVWLCLFESSASLGGLLIASVTTVIGYQTCLSAICGKQAALATQLHPENPTFSDWVRFFSLEKALIVGGIGMLLGAVGMIASFWLEGQNSPAWRLLVPSLTLLILGFQTGCFRFFLSLIQLCADWDRRPAKLETAAK